MQMRDHVGALDGRVDDAMSVNGDRRLAHQRGGAVAAADGAPAPG